MDLSTANVDGCGILRTIRNTGAARPSMPPDVVGDQKDEFAARVPGFLLTCFGNQMQKPNYQFEKRRKELEKKAKKEAKRRQKLEAARSPDVREAAAPSSPVEGT